MPALNLANCWELCYVTQSAGNLLSLDLKGIFRDYTLEFICCSLPLWGDLSVSLKKVLHNKYGLRDYTNKALFVNSSNTQFAHYIAGLIEGDGTIHIPKSERSTKGSLNYPSIQIVFHLKDLPLALLIQKELGYGSISRKKGLNAYIYTVKAFDGIMLLISLLNGNMKTNKNFAKLGAPRLIILRIINRRVLRLIDWYNQYKGTSIEKKGLNTDPIRSNAWLSGFIDSEGHFSLRSTESGKYPKIECKFELCQRQKDHNNKDNLFVLPSSSLLCRRRVLEEIAISFYSVVKSIRNNTANSQYRIRTTSLKANLAVVDYLTKYPLFGTKFSDFKDWAKVVERCFFFF